VLLQVVYHYSKHSLHIPSAGVRYVEPRAGGAEGSATAQKRPVDVAVLMSPIEPKAASALRFKPQEEGLRI